MTAAEPAEPVRVVHFSDTFLPRRDGIVTALRTLIPALRDAGHGSLLVAPCHPGRRSGEIGLALPSVPMGVADLRFCPPRARYAATIARWSPTLVHVHTPGSVGLLGALTARRLGLPLVATYHTDLHAYAEAYRIPTCALRLGLAVCARRLAVPCKAGKSRTDVIDAINTLLFGEADTIIAPTRAIVERARILGDHPRVTVVPTAVGLPVASQEAGRRFRSRWGIPPQAPLVLFVGRVNAEKGIELLARAFSVVLAALPDARLALVGAVYRPRWLRNVLAGAGVAHRTVITGQQPPSVVAAGYAAAQVFGFPSLTDTQGLVLQEASLAGVPSVMVDNALHTASPLRESLLLTDPSPYAMGSLLADLLADPARARYHGALARKSAEETDPGRHCEQILSLYRDVQRRGCGLRSP